MWMTLPFLGVFLHALTNHIDNFLVGESEKTEHISTGSLIIFSAFAGLFGVVLSLMLGAQVFDIGLLDRVILVAVGGIEVVAILLYLYALGEEEVTSTALWWSLSPVIAAIASRFLLSEYLSFNQMLGIGVVVLASIVLAFKKSEMKWVFKRDVTALMLTSAFLYGMMYVLFRFSTVSESLFWAGSFWQYLGMIMAGCLFYLLSREYRTGFHELIHKSGAKLMGWNVLNEVLYLAGAGLSMYATLMVPAAFVLAAENIQPLFILMTSAVIAFFVPGYDADDLSRSAVIKKILLTMIMGLGLYLLG